MHTEMIHKQKKKVMKRFMKEKKKREPKNHEELTLSPKSSMLHHMYSCTEKHYIIYTINMQGLVRKE